MPVLRRRRAAHIYAFIGAAAFGLASVAAAFSSSPEALIAARAALGLAVATLAPSTLALIRTMFTDPQQRSMATSVWVMSVNQVCELGDVRAQQRRRDEPICEASLQGPGYPSADQCDSRCGATLPGADRVVERRRFLLGSVRAGPEEGDAASV